MNIFKNIKINKYRRSLGTIFIAILSLVLIVLIWFGLFNPIMHFLFSTEEEYMEDIIGMYESDAIGTLKKRGFKVASLHKKYSINENLMGATISGSEIDLWEEPDQDSYVLCQPPSKCLKKSKF